MRETFEQYLQDKHAAQYQGLDDEMPDNFNEYFDEFKDLDNRLSYLVHREKASVRKIREEILVK